MTTAALIAGTGCIIAPMASAGSGGATWHQSRGSGGSRVTNKKKKKKKLSLKLLLVHCSACIAICPPTTPADPHTPLHSTTAPLNTRHLLAGSQSPQIRHHDFCTPQTPEEDRAVQRQLLCSMHNRWHHWYLTPLPPKITRTPTNNHSLRPNPHRRHAS